MDVQEIVTGYLNKAALPVGSFIHAFDIKPHFVDLLLNKLKPQEMLYKLLDIMTNFVICCMRTSIYASQQS